MCRHHRISPCLNQCLIYFSISLIPLRHRLCIYRSEPVLIPKIHSVTRKMFNCHGHSVIMTAIHIRFRHLDHCIRITSISTGTGNRAHKVIIDIDNRGIGPVTTHFSPFLCTYFPHNLCKTCLPGRSNLHR